MDLKIEKARVALSDMDDYSRMAVGINPVGARAVIETFINDAERIVQALASKDAEIARLQAIHKAGNLLYAAIGNYKRPKEGILTDDLIDAGEAWNKATSALTQPTE